MTVELVGKSKNMLKVRKDIEMCGPTDFSVLIVGESGTGKDVVARHLYEHASKKNKEGFLSVNCKAISGGLAESEFFGHATGSFSGSRGIRRGYFETMKKGTLFLDEIDSLPPSFISKLLRVAEDGTFIRVGESKERVSGARIIAAGSSPIDSMLDAFYNRFKKIIYLHPLRERREDIPLLLDHFTKEFREKYNSDIKFSKGDREKIFGHSYPGNIRQMKHTIERYVVFGEIDFQDKCDVMRFNRGRALDEHLSDFNEWGCIGKAIKEAGGNREKAARTLGISYSFFDSRYNRYVSN